MNVNFQPSQEQDPIKSFTRNLNDQVVKGKTDPVIGRDSEIRRIIEILSRKTKNNPVLIGEPGVGKTAIVEGLAQRIVKGDIPTNLKNMKIYELDVASLVAGASFQGQFEERLKNLLKKVTAEDSNIILFIDELHLLVGAGKTQGSMDAANILKPLLARGEIKVIGATTLNEYRQYIEKDAALERRFQKIIVNEPDETSSLTILRGLKNRWEVFHGVKIHDTALVAAVKLSERYITDRFLPDKAIDLIDEACSKIKTEVNSVPTVLDEVNRQIMHLETEKASINNTVDTDWKEKQDQLNEKIISAKKEQEKLLKKWEAEKKEVNRIKNLKHDLEQAEARIDTLQQEGKYVEASKLLYETIPNLKKEIQETESKNSENENTLIKEDVTENEIAEVISKWTGIPLTKLLETEKIKLLNLKKDLRDNIKGQDEALEIVSNAILRSRSGIADKNRPVGTFIFQGSTGVGKTELAKTLARELFNSEKAMIRIDMSEYMEKNSVSRLIGSPPGYVGYEQGGQLTEKVRRYPYSIILFDEIEKANSEVLNVLLQVLDDGRITDGQGRTINFNNTIIIMTTNIGNDLILDGKPKLAELELKKYLKPEFLNRIDEIVVFNKLDDNAIKQIIDKQLILLKNKLSDNNIKINFDSKLINYIFTESYTNDFGARPIRRFIQKNIENKLAEEIIAGKFKNNKTILVTVKDNNIIIELSRKN